MYDAEPDGWEQTTLGAVATLGGGTTPSKSEESYWSDGTIPWATPSDITSLPNGTTRIGATEAWVTDRALKECSLPLNPPGTILMTSRATIGYVALNDVPMTTNQGFINFRCGDATDPEFLLHWLTAKRGFLVAAAGGSTFKELSRGTAKRLPILLPPLDEQRRIAEVLRSVDETIETTERTLSQSRLVKSALLQDLFAKGLYHSDDKQKPIGPFSSRWEMRPLGSCFENLDSRRRPVKKEDRARMKGSIPYYGASGIIDWVSDYLFDEPLLLLAEDGANLISKSTPIAFISTGKSWVNNHAHVYRPTSTLDIEIAEEWLRFTDISSFVTGSAQPKLNKDRADAILMPIPPANEQAVLRDIFRAINNAIAEEANKLRILEGIKTNISNDLLSGRVRVPA